MKGGRADVQMPIQRISWFSRLQQNAFPLFRIHSVMEVGLFYSNSYSIQNVRNGDWLTKDKGFVGEHTDGRYVMPARQVCSLTDTTNQNKNAIFYVVYCMRRKNFISTKSH